MGVALVHGFTTAMRKDLWRELAGVAATFQRSPLLIGGDFNVTLGVKDKPIDMEGRDHYLDDF